MRAASWPWLCAAAVALVGGASASCVSKDSRATDAWCVANGCAASYPDFCTSGATGPAPAPAAPPGTGCVTQTITLASEAINGLLSGATSARQLRIELPWAADVEWSVQLGSGYSLVLQVASAHSAKLSSSAPSAIRGDVLSYTVVDAAATSTSAASRLSVNVMGAAAAALLGVHSRPSCAALCAFAAIALPLQAAQGSTCARNTAKAVLTVPIASLTAPGSASWTSVMGSSGRTLAIITLNASRVPGSPVAAPVASPVTTPVASPVAAPVAAPVTPVAAPVAAPVAPSAPSTSRPTAPVPPVLSQMLAALSSKAASIDSSFLLYQTPTNAWVPSAVYKSSDMIAAVQVMATAGANGLTFYAGTSTDGVKAATYGLVNLAAFLAQAKKEAIQYDACDENSWDLINGVYPLSNACGQLAQSYQEYKIDSATDCAVDPNMQITATTHAKWYGAPPPLRCAPKTVTGATTVGWNPSGSCGPWGPPTPPCNVYAGQQGGAYTTSTAANGKGRTDVEGCCWWGRGVIQSTGIGNYGKLNYYLGAKAASRGASAPYADIDFCKTPEAVCSSTKYPELKWIAGLFYWMQSVQSFDSSGFNYMARLKAFVDGGMSDTTFIDAVSGIVNRGCPSSSCPAGAVDGISDRRDNFNQVLKVFSLKP